MSARVAPVEEEAVGFVAQAIAQLAPHGRNCFSRNSSSTTAGAIAVVVVKAPAPLAPVLVLVLRLCVFAAHHSRLLLRGPARGAEQLPPMLLRHTSCCRPPVHWSVRLFVATARHNDGKGVDVGASVVTVVGVI